MMARKKLVGNTGSRNASRGTDIHFRMFFPLLGSPHSSGMHTAGGEGHVCMFHPSGRDGRQ